ncbi:sensor protein QseC [Methyloglobulus morosus KoM1]|uniref:histidine kinase n=1 Tax=Methyloglobulus morosus KoM1 TaxID=1116472 RepID=V5BXZ6_9GAMM|nr:ATP-binding protein [Methyloglobulus morosus]ESS69428.1 sensor protein QseC [Methyloglobulus morosus KoM1]
MNYSLRQLLLVTLLSASMLIWGITAYINYRVTRDEVAALFDAELAQSGKVLLAFLDSLPQDSALEERLKLVQTDVLGQDYDRKIAFQLKSENDGLLLHSKAAQHFPIFGDNRPKNEDPLWDVFDELLQADAFGHKYERKIAFQLWSKESGLLLRSESSPKFALSSSIRGFSEKTIDDHLWHVFSITNATGDYVIHVGQQEEIRAQLTDDISWHLVTQFLVGLPLLGIVIWFIVGYALKPLSRLERALSKREASFLKPLSAKKLPKEVVPVVKEINNLFAQLEQAFEHERRFTADASHELRTPLAGLLTQAQVALRTTDEAVRKQALLRISQAVHRMTYMVQQLLTFSRIESGKEYLAKEITFVNREVIQVITELEPAAHKKRIQIEFVEQDAVPIFANTQLITILVRNVIDNAIKYTPAGGNIVIYLEGSQSQLQFRVEDSGPGIPPDQYENSLKRFHRCVETAQTAQGSGLGFSIVERITSMYGAELALGVSQFGGLKVTVIFPVPRRQEDKPLAEKPLVKNTAKA